MILITFENKIILIVRYITIKDKKTSMCSRASINMLDNIIKPGKSDILICITSL